MYSSKKIISFMDKILDIENIKDASLNGIQVEGINNIAKIAGAVDLSLESIKKTIEKKADMLIVHHGIFWKNNEFRITGLHKKRIQLLVENNINVYAAHLPLDLHEKYGNNIEICKKLGLKSIKAFGDYHGVKIGYFGELLKAADTEDFIKYYSKKIHEPSCSVIANNKVKRVGIVSGGGSSLFHECEKLGIDTFITGEQNYTVKNFAEESGINIIFGGHYYTETFGIKKMLSVLQKKFPKISTVFFDLPSVL